MRDHLTDGSPQAALLSLAGDILKRQNVTADLTLERLGKIRLEAIYLIFSAKINIFNSKEIAAQI